MPVTYKVLSIRLPVKTIAGCFMLLEEVTGTLRVPMSKAVRTVVEAMIDTAIKDGKVPDFDNDEALKYISERTTNEATGLTINVTPPNLSTGMVKTTLPQEPKSAGMEQRRLEELIEPHVQQAKKRVDEERMKPFSADKEDMLRTEEDSAPPAPVTDTPPWQNSAMSPASDLMTAQVQSPLIKEGFDNGNQLLLLAGRVVLHTSIGTPGGSRFEKLLNDVYLTFRDWTLKHPDVEIPVSIRISAQKNGKD